jgi:hypothetical protein
MTEWYVWHSHADITKEHTHAAVDGNTDKGENHTGIRKVCCANLAVTGERHDSECNGKVGGMR